MAVVFALLAVFSFNAFCAGEKELVYPFLYGEKNFTLKAARGDLFFHIDPRMGKQVFEEERRRKNFFFESSDLRMLELSDFFQDLKTAGYCPDRELAERFSYIRYLYRLAALSYLDEHLYDMNVAAKKMRLGTACSYEPKELLNKCRPGGEDMKLFVQSAGILAKSFKPFMPAYDFSYDEYLNKWLSAFKKGEAPGSPGKRLGLYCRDKDCDVLNKERAKIAFEEVCREDKELFLRVCSEKDRLYGLSGAAQAFHAIASSEALKYIDDKGNGRGCLLRFSRLMKSREGDYRKLEKVMAGVYDRFQSEREKGGRLFPAGSLKSYLDSGLTSIFVEPKKEATEKKNEEVALAPVELAPLAPEPIKRILKPKPAPKKKVAEEKTRPKPVVKSYFLTSVEAREEFGLDSMPLDMLKFKYDYVFNSKTLAFLDKHMEKFVSRKGLAEMKEYDSLGKKKGPVPLLFIKYLIDEKRHKGLTNLVEVIGETFYVQNNIDPPSLAKKPVFVRLRYDRETEGLWQIDVLALP